MTDLGLTLSGGGARGAAHIGALKALAEYKIRPQIIAGTSTGAVIGGLFATGLEPDDILSAFKRINLFRLSNYAFGKPGLVDGSKFIPLLHTFISENTFESLEIPLIVGTTDLLKGEAVYFSSGKFLIESLVASAALPGVFSPVEIEGNWYVDGGIIDNLPLAEIRSRCHTLLAIDVNKILPIEAGRIHHTFDVIERSIHLAISQIVKMKQGYDLLIQPENTPDYGVFDMNRRSLDALFDIGYQEMKAQIPELLDIMKEKQPPA